MAHLQAVRNTLQAQQNFKESGVIVKKENSPILTNLYNAEKMIFLYRIDKTKLDSSTINATLNEIRKLVPPEFFNVKADEVKKLVSTLQNPDSTVDNLKIEQYSQI